MLLYIPTTVFTFIPHATESEIWKGVQTGCWFSSCLYLIYQGWGMVLDLYKLGCRKYMTSFNSFIEVVIFLLMIGFLIYTDFIAVRIFNQGEVQSEKLETLTCIEIGAILILNLQLFRFLKIFEFF